MTFWRGLDAVLPWVAVIVANDVEMELLQIFTPLLQKYIRKYLEVGLIIPYICPNHKNNMKLPPEVIWIKQNKDVLNITSIARKIGIPRKAFWNYCNDIHTLNEKWWKPVQEWVINFKKNPA